LAQNAREKNSIRDLNKARVFKLFLIFLLVLSVIAEGYYIYLLKDTIEKRNDELKNISIQLQFLKNEREDLKETLSSTQKTGDAGDGHTSER